MSDSPTDETDDSDTITPTYDREIGVEIEDLRVDSKHRVRLGADVCAEHDLNGSLVDAAVDYGPGSFPAPERRVSDTGRMRLPAASCRRYAVTPGMLVDVTIEGVITDERD